MTISSSSMGPNSTCLAIDNDTVANVIVALGAILVAQGYVVYDNITSTNIVYQGSCVDNTKYYLQLTGSGNALNIKLYDTWNTGSHTGTNQASTTSSSLNNVTVTITTSCNLYVFAQARYVFILLNNGAASNPFSGGGVFEFMRENALDTTGNGLVPVFTASWSTITGGNNYVGGTCKSLQASTGIAACALSALMSLVGVGGTNSSNAESTISTAGVAVAASTPYYINSWNSTTSFELRGKVYGLKMIPNNFGTVGDVTTIKLDSNGMTDPNGTNTDHFIFGGFTLPL